LQHSTLCRALDFDLTVPLSVTTTSVSRSLPNSPERAASLGPRLAAVHWCLTRAPRLRAGTSSPSHAPRHWHVRSRVATRPSANDERLRPSPCDSPPDNPSRSPRGGRHGDEPTRGWPDPS